MRVQVGKRENADAKVVTSNLRPLRPHPLSLLAAVSCLRIVGQPLLSGFAGCSYQGTKYNHADQVITPEPCLNCTCKRGVLLCFLKVCPALLHHSSGHGCQTVREAGQCCPVLKCQSQTASLVEDWGPTMATITTAAAAFLEKQTVGLHVNDLHDGSTNSSEAAIKAHSSSSVRLTPETQQQHATTSASYPSSGKETDDGVAAVDFLFSSAS